MKAQPSLDVQPETLTFGEDPEPTPSEAPVTSPGAAQPDRPAVPAEARRFNLWHASIMAQVALFMVLGLIAVGVADQASLRGANYGNCAALFLVGLVAIFVPAALRALTRNVSRPERLALVIALGLALYAVKIMGSPSSFTFIDEYIHQRNTENILTTHHLFGLNPLLPAAAYYPGLAAACAGLVNLTGLSTFVSGLLIIGAARLLISACFFLLAEKVTGSALAAAGASLIYAANPMFLFWSASFSYENLALPLAAFVIWWISRTRDETNRMSIVIAVVAIIAVTVTHHIAAFALAALLGAWWLAGQLFRRSDPSRHKIGAMALVAGSTSLAWFFLVAGPAAHYLFGENFLPTAHQVGALLFGHAQPRHLYGPVGGTGDPSWYVLAGFTAMALIVLALPPALYRSWRIALGRRGASADRRQGINVGLVIAMAMAAAFPVSQLLRLTTDGDTLAGRSSEYLFTGLGCVLALLVEKPIQSTGVRTALRTLLAAGLATVVLVGTTTIANTYTELLPEVQNPHGYPWTVQPDVIKASEWAREHLGIDQVFAVGAIDSEALATYGEEDVVSYNAWPIFLSSTMSDVVVDTIRTQKVRYLFMDWRMTQGIPNTPGDYYFSPWEPQAGEYTHPLPVVMLQKFATTNCSHLIYDSGLIRIFDVTLIENGSCLPTSATTGFSG